MDGDRMDLDSTSQGPRGLKRPAPGADAGADTANASSSPAGASGASAAAASAASAASARPRKIQVSHVIQSRVERERERADLTDGQKALDPDVINKIAAGEIIVAPMHALKELIENSVDAGSTSVEILVREGGLKLLQITDNGHGIDHDDLSILCERFTTSKLQAFEDLSSIATYGFRGEALASISHVAHLTVTTKTAGSSCAWRAHYSDGKLVPAKPGQNASPKPIAGRKGTQITVSTALENPSIIFSLSIYMHMLTRSASEEYAKILDIVGRYAVHCSGTAFSCKKHGEAGVSLSTSINSSILDRIRQLHGGAVANELVSLEVDGKRWGCRASAWVTNANYHAKKTTLLIFINHRAVESTAIKRAVEQTYSTFLPKGGHPFVYLDLEIEPQRLDVNVHPTKREVNFLNEDEIIESICSAIRTKLAAVDSSRTFMTQTLLPGIRPPEPATLAGDASSGAEGERLALRTVAGTKRPYENNLVRTDAKLRKITSMLPPAGSETVHGDKPSGNQGLAYQKVNREPVNIRLTSVKNLRAAVRSSMHNNLTEIFSSNTYVGLVDERRRVAAIQSGVKLYLVDYGMVCNEFFYQLGLTNFGNFGSINLESSPKLVDLLSLAVEVERDEYYRNNPPDGDAASVASDASRSIDEGIVVDFTSVAATVAKHLIDRREMLKEYFSLSISEDGCLLSIPLLLKGYMPSLVKLPRFLLRLGPYVDWSGEEACFRTFLTELAAFYTPEQLPTPYSSSTPQGGCGRQPGPGARESSPHSIVSDISRENGVSATESPQADQSSSHDEAESEDESVTRRREQLSWMLEHTLFPAIRSRVLIAFKHPPSCLYSPIPSTTSLQKENSLSASYIDDTVTTYTVPFYGLTYLPARSMI
ncbi:DNA mismatch repair protein, putative [Trichophyton verrucosum HKI 0517]|uniref:DNA mismatch repair protein, putative n=1 Tax=Trichophyton verrucosum (strain HKI 0517) TaxID=663202 RepID=D4D3T1_TRIVH|nr:DNA mismatch repair protein, putative [Trichophyton verrucosum HKI 0517]EFE43490.1 DNA mismatch repair protein, putative [Trichophyton verrucosum HKI 0517]